MQARGNSLARFQEWCWVRFLVARLERFQVRGRVQSQVVRLDRIPVLELDRVEERFPMGGRTEFRDCVAVTLVERAEGVQDRAAVVFREAKWDRLPGLARSIHRSMSGRNELRAQPMNWFSFCFSFVIP